MKTHPILKFTLSSSPINIKTMKRAIVIFISLLTFFSCKKEKDDSKSCTTDVASISGSYKITSMLYKESPSGTETEVFAFFTEPCERDNILTLKTDGTYHNEDAGTKCDPPADEDGTWTLSGTTISVDGDPATIESFDCKKLIVLYSDYATTGDQVKLILTRQ